MSEIIHTAPETAPRGTFWLDLGGAWAAAKAELSGTASSAPARVADPDRADTSFDTCCCAFECFVPLWEISSTEGARRSTPAGRAGQRGAHATSASRKSAP